MKKVKVYKYYNVENLRWEWALNENDVNQNCTAYEIDFPENWDVWENQSGGLTIITDKISKGIAGDGERIGATLYCDSKHWYARLGNGKAIAIRAKRID